MCRSSPEKVAGGRRVWGTRWSASGGPEEELQAKRNKRKVGRAPHQEGT